jgi:hypothetical protein
MPYLLPARFRYSHDFAVFLHDLIVGKLQAGIDHRIFDVELKFQPGDEGIAGLNGEELYEWIEAHRGPEVTIEMDYKNCVRALLGDFCQFVLEGLRASAKGKLAVAYALLRKPFKDNLFYLEWLLADPTDFLTRFRTQDADAIDVGKLSLERRREIVTAATGVADGSGTIPGFTFDLRYDRTAEYGLSGTWDRASHLITSWKHARTENQNFNFIFSGPVEWQSQWEHIYRLVPYLLHHAVHVADALIGTLGAVTEQYAAMKSLRQGIGFIEWVRSAHISDDRQDPAAAALIERLTDLPLSCPECGRAIRFHSQNLRRFAVRGYVICSSCRTKVVLDDTNAPAD